MTAVDSVGPSGLELLPWVAQCGACERRSLESTAESARVWLARHSCTDCPNCDGAGQVRSLSGQSFLICSECEGSGNQ